MKHASDKTPGTTMNRRSLIRTGFGAGITAAAIAGMSFPRSLGAQTPESSPAASPVASPYAATPEALRTIGQIPAKTLNGTMVLANPGEPKSFNGDFQVDDFAWPINCNIYNTLLSLDNSYNVIPELATGYTTSDDGLRITFKLNELASWHDGTPVSSYDVKYTLEQIVADKAATASGYLASLDHVETPDQLTAVLVLKQPSASIIGFLSWYGVFIMPAHLYQGTDWTTNPVNMKPVGSGPFKFSSYSAGSSVELVANESYFGEGPYLEKLVFQIIPDDNTQVQALLNGEVDYLPAAPSDQVSTLQATPGYKVAEKVYPSPIYFGFNFKKDPLKNVDVRRALAMAVDRNQILGTALGGLGTIADRFYPAVIEWASDPKATVPALDVDGANALLDKAGFPKNGDSRFSLKMYYFTSWPEVADTCTILVQQFDAIGVKLELVALESGAWEDQVRAGAHDLAILGGFQGPDPANLASRVGTGGTLNFWFYSNPKVDDLLAKGDAGTSQEARVPFYFQAQELLAQDLPVIQVVLQTSYTPFIDTAKGIWTDADDPAASKVGMNRFTLTQLGS